jgi:hypothetical protein
MALFHRTLLLASFATALIAILVAVDLTAGMSLQHSTTLAVAAAAIAPAKEQLDILVGARAIADFTGLSTNQVYHQHKIGALPITQQGSLLIASKSRLRAHFQAQVELVPEAEAAAQAPSVPEPAGEFAAR